MYTKFSKCHFWLTDVTFLGHVVSVDGIKVDSVKIEAVVSWVRLTTPTGIHSFLGLPRILQTFCRGVLSPSTTFDPVDQKGVKFVWSDKCGSNFQALKDQLTTAPILSLLTPRVGYVVYSDAS